MSPAPPRTTRELDASTWPDFEELFAPHGGVQAGCWCMFYRRERPLRGLSLEERRAKNRRDHEAQARDGTAHGILVYEAGRAVGWCQFGRRSEIARFDRGRIYPKLRLPAPRGELWRISCFFVDGPHRRAGVARRALHAALGAIARQGGGTVEAFPATHSRAVGLWFGTVAMFEREGFARVAPWGASHAIYRRYVAPKA